MPIAEYVGRETVVEALGKKWTVGRLTRSALADQLAWARKDLPNPVDEAIKQAEKIYASSLPDAIKDAQANQILAEAREAKRGHLSDESPDIQSRIQSFEGGVRLFWLILKTHHPDVTEDEAFAIAEEVGPEKLAAIFDRASGVAKDSLGNE